MSAPALSGGAPAGEVGALPTPSLRAYLRELHLAASAVPIRTFEEDERAPLEELRATADVLLVASVNLLEMVARRLDSSASLDGGEAGPTSMLYEEIDARLACSVDAAGVADVAAVGRMVLRGRQLALSDVALQSAFRWEVVDVTAGALRALKKALGAVDAAMAQLENAAVSSPLHLSEIARSLLVRREYFRFRRDLLALGRRCSAPMASAPVGVADATEVRARLRGAGNLIARLVGADAYEHLRTKDRVMLRAFQRRIREYLVGSGSHAEQHADGMRIWQDLEILAELFAGVNRREDLVLHDTVLLAGHLAALAAVAERDDGPAPPAVVESLRAALGRDDELDQVLCKGRVGLTAGELCAAVRRASERLARPAHGAIQRASRAPSESAEPPAGSQDDFF